MHFVRVHIKNYRSIADVTIQFDPTCRVLVGVNESGKSNILKALALLDTESTIENEDLREFGPDEQPDQEAFVRFVFVLTPDEIKEAAKDFSTKVYEGKKETPILQTDGRELSFKQFCEWRREVLYEVSIRTQKRRWTYWSLWNKSEIKSGWFKPKPGVPADITVGPQASPISSLSLLFPDNQKINEEYLQPVTVDELNKIVGNAFATFAETKSPKVVFWSYADSNLLPGKIATDAFVNNPRSCMPLKQMFALAGHASPTKAIQDAQTRPNGMRNLLERVSDATTKHLLSVWKDNRGVRINLIQNGDHIDATIEDTFNHYDMSRRSDGFKRFVTFILLVSAQAKTKNMENTLYLHDEPDISLHPAGARYLRDELIKISSKNYVVYSTHSIFMIDREAIGRHLIVSKKAEVTSIEPVSDSNIVDEEVIYNALGYSVFESLRPMNIIFEGWRDKQLFVTGIGHLRKSARQDAEFLAQIGRCHVKGVKDVGRITPMIELAAKQCMILSDGDKVARDYQRDYQGFGKWIRYDELLQNEVAQTSEDFIKPDSFRSPITEARRRYSELTEFDFRLLAATEPKMLILERWVQKSGIQGDKKKLILDEIKGALIENLKPAHIEDKYFNLLKELVIQIQAYAQVSASSESKD